MTTRMLLDADKTFQIELPPPPGQESVHRPRRKRSLKARRRQRRHRHEREAERLGQRKKTRNVYREIERRASLRLPINVMLV